MWIIVVATEGGERMKLNNLPKTCGRVAEGSSSPHKSLAIMNISTTMNRQYLWKFYCFRHYFQYLLEMISFGPLLHEMPSVVISVLFMGQVEKENIINYFMCHGLLITCYLSFPNYLTLAFNCHELNSLLRRKLQHIFSED